MTTKQELRNERYRRIVHLLSLGMSYKMIAADLNLNERAIHERIRYIRSLYGADNTVHLVSIFFRKNIIQ